MSNTFTCIILPWIITKNSVFLTKFILVISTAPTPAPEIFFILEHKPKNDNFINVLWLYAEIKMELNSSHKNTSDLLKILSKHCTSPSFPEHTPRVVIFIKGAVTGSIHFWQW